MAVRGESAESALMDATSPTLVGRFSYRPDTDAWTWSDAMFHIHGFEPGEVVPTTELVMRHIHPDDRSAAWASREQAMAEGMTFTFPHRISAADGQQRVVIAAGHRELDDEGPVITGHLVDLTDLGQEAVQAQVDQVVQDFTVHRALIEQAKGVLMQLLSVDADTAWSLLRAYSQHTNRRVRDLAELLVEAAANDETPAKGQLTTSLMGTIDAMLARPES